jgi:hypothetical protein
MLDQPNLSYKERENQKKEIMRHVDISTLIKKKINFSSYIRKLRMHGAVAKSYIMTNGLLI